jgi:acetylornithine deacetylase/succinyl-diaminopimelate desuccinylase-like protein
MFAQELQNSIDSYLEELKNLVRIPSISFPGFDQQEVIRSAKAVEKLLEKIEAKNIQQLLPKSSYPCVYGEIITDKNKPTILLYAHHDDQPPMREALWLSPPFEPEIRNERLYGRGTADDKAGIIIHIAAVELILKELKSNNSKANIHPTCSRKTGRNKTSPKQRDKAVEPQKLFT